VTTVTDSYLLMCYASSMRWPDLEYISEKWSIAVTVSPMIAVILTLKFFVHTLGWEIISLNPLFNSIVSANVFLLGFLVAGTLTDYKESEKLPGDLAASIDTIADEIEITYKNKKAKSAKEALNHLMMLTDSLMNWFYKKEDTTSFMCKIAGLNAFFLVFESLTQPNFIIRMKQEQNNIRRMLIRIQTIRDTSFVTVGYTIAEITTGFLILGFIFSKISPFYESIFFVGIGTFFMIYMNLLIRDLDNPFDYVGKVQAANVSLKPLRDLKKRLKERVKQL
jgi:hypothetical protein